MAMTTEQLCLTCATVAIVCVMGETVRIALDKEGNVLQCQALDFMALPCSPNTERMARNKFLGQETEVDRASEAVYAAKRATKSARGVWQSFWAEQTLDQ